MQRHDFISTSSDDIVSIDAVKEFARVCSDDEDITIKAFIDAAIAHFRNLGIPFVADSWRLTLQSLDTSYLIKRPKVYSASVKYVDVDGNTKQIPKDKILVLHTTLGTNVTVLESAIEAKSYSLEYMCGYESLVAFPKDLAFAIIATAAHWYDNRSDDSERTIPLSVQGIVDSHRWIHSG